MSQGICAPQGFTAGGYCCSIKPSGAPDLAIVAADSPCTVAGVFTKNRFAAPSVRYNRAVVGRGRARAIVTNSGIANAATGAQGFDNTMEVARLAAGRLGIDSREVLCCSTGIIGVQLPMPKIAAGIERIVLSRDGGPDAATAILTTDQGPKFASCQVATARGLVTLGAMCKGAGMIHPNMATMLAFVTTDARVAASDLHALTAAVADSTFNMISIDGDSSTNDSLLTLASGASGIDLAPGDADWAAFADAYQELAWEMAAAIVAGGEGVNRVFEVSVVGASSVGDARLTARAISASMLVKTAIHGADPNFGRCLCAAGYSGAMFDPDRMDMFIGPVQMMRSGAPIAFDAAAASAEMSKPRSIIALDLHSGPHTARAVGCELSSEYVVFNSEYTT